MKFYTIGVYESTEHEYFKKLTSNEVDTFCDIRLRRGVRGSKYAFVNSKRLQQHLHELKINYVHILSLAPTKKIRILQKKTDINLHQLKADRNTLGSDFVNAYKKEILNKFNFDTFINELIKEKSRNIVLFCVESKALACHRSIVANKLRSLGFQVEDL